MAIERSQISSKSWVDESTREKKLLSGSALATANGICLGIVKNNIDPARRGRLQVWIPDQGGLEDDPR